MSVGATRNFGAAVRERDRRNAAMLENPSFGLAQAAYLGPEWDAFYGSLHDVGQAANEAGLGFRADLSGIGRMDDDISAGGLNPLERDSLKRQALNQMSNAAGQQARVQNMTQDAFVDAQARQQQADMDRAYGQHVVASMEAPPIEPTTVTTQGNRVTTRPAGTAIDQMLARLPPAARAKVQADMAARQLERDKLDETKRHNTAMEGKGDNDTNVSDAITGMREGTLPPILPGRASKDYTSLLAEAKRQGYDLATAAADWQATQKHFATLNGSQQTRIRQAADTAYHSLDTIDELAKKWDAGKFPLLNKAQLGLAKQGAFGKDAQSIANQLDAQISDLTSELANVYMGGNSPTDHALGLAAKNLSADWSKDVLLDMTNLARTNLKYRQNAIKNVGAITPSSQKEGANDFDEEWTRDANGKLVKKGKG